jgi:hypothetical protein
MSSEGVSSPANAGLTTDEPVNLDEPQTQQDDASEGDDETGEEVDTDQSGDGEEQAEEGEGSEDGEGEGEGQEQAAADADTAEIEVEGKKYKVPAALKDGYLRTADYTQKTQALAAERKALETRDAAARQHIQEYAGLINLDSQIKAYDDVDWAAFEQADPQGATTEWRKLSLLKEQRANAADSFRQKEHDRTLEMQRTRATRIEEAQAVLKKDIPGWSPELAQKVLDFAANTFGFKPEEIASVTDPRVVKVLHSAMTNAQQVKEVKKVEKKVEAIKTVQKTAPAPQARSGASPTTPKDPAKMSDAQYYNWRKAQIAAGGG